MIPFAAAVETFLEKLVASAIEQIEGMPDSDLNNWKPALGMEDVNTMFALSTHLLGAGEFWILSAAAGRPIDRDRPAEFVATGTASQLRHRYADWLRNSHA